MKFLADTHILMWSAAETRRLSAAARRIILDPDMTPMFSVISLWELGIKAAKRFPGFDGDSSLDSAPPPRPRLAGTAGQRRARPCCGRSPPIHGDPFDRMLVAQATVEGALLLTADRTVARYPGPVRLV